MLDYCLIQEIFCEDYVIMSKFGNSIKRRVE